MSLLRARLIGRLGMTPREAEMAELAIEGLSNREICARLGKSYSHVKKTVRAACLKAGGNNREQLILKIAGLRPAAGEENAPGND